MGDSVSAAVSPLTRQAIWNGMLDAARMVRYADAMEQRYAKQRKWVRIVLSLGASAGIAAFLSELPEAVSLVFGLAVGVAVALDFTTDYSGKLAKLMYAKMECSALLSEWEALWIAVETHRYSESESQRLHARLLERLNQATAPMAADMHTDPGINRESSRDAYHDVSTRFAAG